MKSQNKSITYVEVLRTIEAILLIDPRVQHRVIRGQRFTIQIATECWWRRCRMLACVRFAWHLWTGRWRIWAGGGAKRSVLVALLTFPLNSARRSGRRVEGSMGTSWVRRDAVGIGSHSGVVVGECCGINVWCNIVVIVVAGCFVCWRGRGCGVPCVVILNVSRVVRQLLIDGTFL